MSRVPTRSILVATDLTPGSDGALRTAAALAERTGATLHLLHACEFAVIRGGEEGLACSSFEGTLRAAGRALEAQASRTLPAGVQVGSCEVTVHATHRAILEQAETVGAELIVLGPHRSRGRVDLLWGSTADRLARGARVPCLVTRGRVALPFGRVVVPVDLAHPARRALSLALGWCTVGVRDDPLAGGAEMRVVHVLPRLVEGAETPFERAVVGPRLHDELEAAVAKARAPDVQVREEILWGSDPALQIVRYAREERAGLVVMATHGRGMVRRVLEGSVSSAVARSAPCPVLLLPPDVWREGAASARAGRESRRGRVRRIPVPAIA